MQLDCLTEASPWRELPAVKFVLIIAKICLEERHSLHMDHAASCAGLHPHNPTEVNGMDIEFQVGFDQVFLIQMFQFEH